MKLSYQANYVIIWCNKQKYQKHGFGKNISYSNLETEEVVENCRRRHDIF